MVIDNGPPRPVDIEDPMTHEAWTQYHQRVWDARLRTHLHARYFSRVHRWLHLVAVVLETVATFGTGGAFATYTAGFDPAIFCVLSFAGAAAAAVLQGTKLAHKVEQANFLAQAWEARCAYWDDAFRRVTNSEYLGDLTDMERPELRLRDVEKKLWFLEWSWYVQRVQRQLLQRDPLARQRPA